MVVGPTGVMARRERRHAADGQADRPRDRRELHRDVRAARPSAHDDHVPAGEEGGVPVVTRVDDRAAEALAIAKRWIELAREEPGRDDDRVEGLAVDRPCRASRPHGRDRAAEPDARADAGLVGVTLEVREHVVAQRVVRQAVVEREIGERGLLLRGVRAERGICEAGIRPPDPADRAGPLEHDRLEPGVEQPARAGQPRGTGADDRDRPHHGRSIGRTLMG